MASPDTGMKIVLLAGTLTFANEWLQTKEINWRVPVATVLAGAAVAGVGRISPGGATSLGLMALLVAAVTPLNGKSPIQEIGSVVNGSGTTKTKVTSTKAG
jgi:hypothetical protein